MDEFLPATTPELREKLLNGMCELGQRYLRDGNVEESLRWLNAAADLGSDFANLELGKIYSYGVDVPKDYPKAAEYFEKSGDDLYNGFDEVCYNFGDMYRTGDGVEKNIDNAIAWYEQIVEWCHSDVDKTFLALAEIYFRGDGVEQDIDKALEYYEWAADGGNVQAAYKPAKIYRDGAGVEKDLDEAQRYLDKTIEGLLKKFKE